MSEERTVIRCAEPGDRAFWFSLDRHLPEAEFDCKVRDRMAYVLLEAGEPAGLLRYGLFWDSIPICNMLYIRQDARRRGYGRLLVAHWEQEMKARGHDLVMTSTRADEEAQHFYRSLGYRDCGGFLLDFPGYEQPLELVMARTI